MGTQRAKSPCCSVKFIRFGNRRRQCSKCKKTWRIRQKKRGQKTKYESEDFVIKYLDRKVPTLYTLAKIKNSSARQLRLKLRRSLFTFVHNNPWPSIPDAKPLIALADGMIININQTTYTFYFILLREINTKKAIITKPYIRRGTEVAQGWYEAFNQLPKATQGAIGVLVCDGQKGLTSLATYHNLIIQRCHFHLLAAIQGRRSRWIRSRHRATGELLYQIASNIITNPDQQSILFSLEKLVDLFVEIDSPVLRKVLSGFIKHYSDFRSYLEYPQFNLPRTNNSVESLIGSIRELCHRAKGFRTEKSLTLWVDCLLKYKKTVTCNGSPTK